MGRTAFARRGKRPATCRLLAALASVTLSFALLSVVAAAPSATAVAARVQIAATFTLAWSVGPLHDTGRPIAESSPTVALLLPGGPAVVVGDRAGEVYAYHLASSSKSGSPVTGEWPAFTETR